MDLSTLYITGFFLFFSAIPFETWLIWLLNGARSVHAKLDVPKHRVSCSKLPLAILLGILCQFLQGYGMGALFDFIPISDPTLLAVVIALCLIVNTWSPFLGFRNNNFILFTLWGFYTHMHGPIFWIFPLLFFLLTFLANSFYVGLLGAVLSLYSMLWVFQLPTLDWVLNAVVLLITFLNLSEKFLDRMEDNSLSLLGSFQNR